MTTLEHYVILRRAGVSEWKALKQAGLTEAELRRHYRRDLRLALDMLTVYGSRRRQTNPELLWRIAQQTLTRKQKRELAELVERWRWL